MGSGRSDGANGSRRSGGSGGTRRSGRSLWSGWPLLPLAATYALIEDAGNGFREIGDARHDHAPSQHVDARDPAAASAGDRSAGRSDPPCLRPGRQRSMVASTMQSGARAVRDRRADPGSPRSASVDRETAAPSAYAPTAARRRAPGPRRRARPRWRWTGARAAWRDPVQVDAMSGRCPSPAASARTRSGRTRPPRGRPAARAARCREWVPSGLPGGCEASPSPSRRSRRGRCSATTSMRHHAAC